MLNTYQMCYPCPRTFVTYVPSLYRPQRAGDLDLFLRRIEANAHAVRVSRPPQDQKSGGGFLPTADS